MNRRWSYRGMMAGVASAFLAILTAACEVSQEGPAPAVRQGGAPAPPLPPAALSELAPDTLLARPLGEGAIYRFVWSARGPWAIHLVSADLTRCELDLLVVPAIGQDGSTRVRTRVTQMVPSAPFVPLAGVNGDFFRLDNGAPLGSEVTGVTGRFSARPALAWGSTRVPWIGIPVRDGDRMLFGPDTIAPAPGNGRRGTQVLGGYPELIDDGRVAGDLGVVERPGFAAARHPRTAIGYDRDEERLWLVVVDGRQTPRSAGMTLPELAGLFLWLGVEEALNLDGGGSSAMLVGDELVSRPSDAEGERPVGNSLWLVRVPGGC